jgi:hypothetical protein
MTQTEKTIQLSPAMCRVLLDALQPIVSGEQSGAQLTLTDDNDGSIVELILQGETEDE